MLEEVNAFNVAFVYALCQICIVQVILVFKTVWVVVMRMVEMVLVAMMRMVDI